MKHDNEKFDEFYQKLEKLMEDYKDDLHPGVCAAQLIMFGCGICFDCAPCVEDANTVIRDSIKSAQERNKD